MTRYSFKAPKTGRNASQEGGRDAGRDARRDERATTPRPGKEKPRKGREPAPFPATPGRRVRERPARATAPRKDPGGEPADSGTPSRGTFASLLRETAREMGLSGSLLPEPSPLAALPYPRELELKNAALRKFWNLHQIPDKPNLVVPSPAPRHYRSTSKRRLVLRGTRWTWDFFAQRPAGHADGPDEWPLESEGHQAVYRKVLEKLREGPYQGLARALNFLIVRGDRERMVLFNVSRMGPEVVRKARMLAGHLLGDPGTGVVAAHLFFDPSKSSYYLEARGPVHAQRLKRLAGPEFLPMDVAGRRYFLHPLGFFQVNTAILPRVLEEVRKGLKAGAADRLLDLYCGCGLFTVPLAADCREAVGVEYSPVSLDGARMAAGAGRAGNLRFVAGKIEPARLHRLLPPSDGTPEVLLLDPPAQGTAPGLIRALAERKPRRVAHLFCGMDVLPLELKAWRKQGYMLAKAVPFDMFPGTDNLEVLVILIPDSYGLLNRKKVRVRPVDEEDESAPAAEETHRAEGRSRDRSVTGKPGSPRDGKDAARHIRRGNGGAATRRPGPR